MRPALIVALALLGPALGGCYRDVAEYCDESRACPGDRPVCLLPEHECAPAEAWGEISGAQQVPPTPSDLDGSVQLARNGAGDLVYQLSGDAAGRELHLHRGQPGEDGGAPVLSLGPGAASGILRGLSVDQVRGVLGGEFYIDAHTATFPGGEARAQLLPLSPQDGTVTLRGLVTGLQVLGTTPSPYVGRATVTLDRRTGALSYELDLGAMPLNTVGGIHVHRGGFHAEGPHIVDVPLTAPKAGQLAADKVFPGQQALYPILLQAGLTYVNIHTERYQSGELRGQLLPSHGEPAAVPFRVPLSGQRVVPAVTTAASGVVHFVLSEDGASLAYRIEHSAAKATAVQLCRAKAGSGGPELARLDGDRGTVALGAAARTELLEGGLYVTVATAAYPGGELRGQVVVPRFGP